MSCDLINRNPDLKKLRDEGYEIEVRSGHLLVRRVPYVNSRKEIAFGVLVTPLGDMAGDKTTKPQTHVIYFVGDHPCDKDGNIIKGIAHSSAKTQLADGLVIDHSFSNKPANGFENYYDKILHYLLIISSQAESIDHTVTAKTFKIIDSEDRDAVFNYLDTNTIRSEIIPINAKLENLKVAIIGLGGTGSYVLDFLAKTPVKEIHLYDGDEYLSHNAFRAPGATSIETLREQPKKVVYFKRVYSNMRRNIFPHEYHLDASRIEELRGLNYVFMCIDDGIVKKSLIEKLTEVAVPFIDVGIGINVIDGRLAGSARVTVGTQEKNDHFEKRISFARDGADMYNTNVQISELNALNAALAVIKWKKMAGFYHDLEKEHHSVYEIYSNKILNEETIS